MSDGRTRRVLVEMFREEWRLHSHLFHGSHFAFFPVLITLLSGGIVSLLVVTGTAPETVFAGLHALIFVFGLHTGSIGFVGRDALQNLLGDVTLLIFSARTLPLSQRRLFAIFVLKDIAYYSLLFLLPMTLGAVSAIFGVRGPSGLLSGTFLVLLLWLTLTLTFVLGMGTTIVALGVVKRGVSGLAVLAAFALVVLALLSAGVDIPAYTPYGMFREPTLPRFVMTVVLTLAVFLIGGVVFDTSPRRSTRTVEPSFRRWWRRVGDPIATKTLLDVHRSAGGFGKVLFSAAILFGVTVGLIDLAGQITGVSPSIGISFGAILGLSGFTTYNWLTQSDDVDSYLAHPLSVTDVFAAKFRAYLLLGPLVAAVFYALALGWRGSALLEATVGAVLLVGVSCYIFGTTVYLTGLSPNEFLFDTVLFAAFGVTMIVPLVPILVVGFALAPVATDLLAALGVAGVALVGVGIVLYRRALPKWSNQYRRT